MRNGTKAAKAGAVELNGKTVMLKWSAVSSGEPPRGILFGQIFMQDKLCNKLRSKHHCPLSRCSTLQELKAQFRLSAAAVSQFWVASMSHSLDGRTVASAKMSTQPPDTKPTGRRLLLADLRRRLLIAGTKLQVIERARRIPDSSL